MRFVRLLAAGLVAGIVLASLSVGLIVPPALAATISDPLDVSDIKHLDFETPKNAGAWKTTVPGSVIKGANKVKTNRGTPHTYAPASKGPDAARGAGIAAQTRQTRAAAAVSKINGPSVKDWTAAQRASAKVAPAIASIKSKWTVPATSLSKFGKYAAGVGAVAGMLQGAQTGFQVGKGLSNSWGLDVEGGLCAPTFGGDWVATLTGTDCTDYFKFDESYLPNLDAPGATSGGKACNLAGTKCVELLGILPENPAQYTARYIFKFSGSAFTTPTSEGFYLEYTTTGSSSVSTAVHCNAYASSAHSACKAAFPMPAYNFDVQNIPGWTVGAGAKIYKYGMGDNPTAKITPVTIPGNPGRTLECVILGSNGQSYTSASSVFTEGSGVTPAPVCPALPDDVVANSVKVSEKSPGLPTAEVWAEETTPEYRAWATAYPECTTGLCYADLRKVMEGTTTQSCFDDLADSECIDWFKDPNKTAVFQCHYAGQLVALSECDHYASTFDPEKRAAGQAYADPATGEAAPAGSTPTGPNPMNTPVQDPEEPRDCFPTGWAALNPVNWVVQPVGCALEKAFVPRASVVDARLADMQARWDTTQPAKLILAVGGIAPALSTLEDGGCGGIPIDLSGIGGGIIPNASGVFLPACPGDFFYPWAIGVKLFLIGGLTLGGFFAIKAQVSRLVGLSGSA